MGRVVSVLSVQVRLFSFFFFNDPAPPEISPLPLPAALPIGPRRVAPGVPRPERDRSGRLAGMGAGARAVLRARLGFVVYRPARDARSGRRASLGGAARGDGGEGDVRVHGAELFPPAPRRCPRRLSTIRQPPRAWQEINCGFRIADCGFARPGSIGEVSLRTRHPHGPIRNPQSAVRNPQSLAQILLALSANPTATTVTAPITLCHSHETDGAPKVTTPTAAIPVIRPKNAPVARPRGIMARGKTPRIEP